MTVEAAFGQLKSDLEVRPVYPFRPDRVRNHVRLCFLAYWLCARLGQEWRAKGERGEVPRLLRRLQAILEGNLLNDRGSQAKKHRRIEMSREPSKPPWPPKGRRFRGVAGGRVPFAR